MKLFGCADLQDQTNVFTFPEAKHVPLTCTLPPQSSDLHCGCFCQIQPAPDRPFSLPQSMYHFLLNAMSGRLFGGIGECELWMGSGVN